MASQHKDKPRGAEAQNTLALAYRSIFRDTGANGELVLADLAEYCGFYAVSNMQAPPGIDFGMFLSDQNARRAVFGRIVHFLNLTYREMKELEAAAIEERKITTTEGPS